MPTGMHAVTVASTDVSHLVEQVTIHHGREDDTGQPEACSATLDVLVFAPDVLPAVVEIGASCSITTSSGGMTYARFTGRITDLHLGWQEAGEDTPEHAVGQLMAVGLLADTGRRVVGDAPFPQELDGARVSRVMALAGVTLDPAYSDPGTAQILPRDIDSQPALNVAQDAANSASGIIWETRAGEIRYADNEHRRGIQPSLSLDAAQLLVSPTWRRATDGLVNDISLGYGASPDGGEQPRYVVSDQASISKWGHYGYSVATALAELADAQAMAGLLLARNSQPVWLMASLPVAVETLDDATYQQLLALDLHSLITITGLPAVGTAPTSANMWVEGWRETLAWGVHELELFVSGYCRTSAPPRWEDVNPSWLWGGEQTGEQRRNRITQPSFEAGSTAGWAAVRGTIALETPPAPAAPAGPTALGYTSSDGSISGGNYSYHSQSLAPAVPGHTYTFSCWVRPKSAAMTTARVWFQWWDASNAYLGVIDYGPTVSVAAGAWTRLRVTATAPPGTAYVGCYALMQPGIPVGDGYWVDGALLEESSTPGTYFDGDTAPIPNASYAWLGARGASASVQSGRRELRRNLVPHGSFRLGTGQNVIVRTSLATNPGAETATGWLSNNGASWVVTRDTSQKHSGTQSALSTPTAATIGTTRSIMSLYNVGGATFAVTAGFPYTASVFVTHNVAEGAEGTAYFGWLDSGGAAIGNSPIVYAPLGPAGTWSRVSATATPPANAVTARIITVVSKLTTNVAGGELAWADDCLVEQAAAVMPYFDGTSPADSTEGIAYSWSGAANASTSLATAAAAGLTGWSVSGGVLYRRPDGAARYLAKAAGNAPLLYPATALPASQVDTWSAGAKVAGTGGNVRIELDTYNTAGGNIAVNPGAYVPNSSAGVRPVVQNVAGAQISADTVGIRPILRWDQAAGNTYTVSEVIAELAATVGAYFDGDRPTEPAFSYAWTGAANASPSVAQQILAIPGGVDASLTWDGASCFGPPTSQGRWDDVAATVRWDQVPATTTWDTWTG